MNIQGRALLEGWLNSCHSIVEDVKVLSQPTYRDGTPKYVEIKVAYNGRKTGIKTTRIYSTAINVLATLRREGVTYLALVEQFRAAIGADAIGNPGGRMEWESTVFETALRELDEELGLPDVRWGNPVDLTEELLNKSTQGSPGTAWEEICVVHIGAKVTSEQLAEFNGHQAGLVAEGEHTKVHLVSIDDVHLHLRDFPARSA